MRENDFERKISEEMEDLKFRPSESVWQNVEQQLHRRKRKRVVFYISLLAGFGLLGYLGYTFNTTSNPLTSNNNEAAHPSMNNINTQTNEITAPNNNTASLNTNAPERKPGANDNLVRPAEIDPLTRERKNYDVDKRSNNDIITKDNESVIVKQTAEQKTNGITTMPVGIDKSDKPEADSYSSTKNQLPSSNPVSTKTIGDVENKEADVIAHAQSSKKEANTPDTAINQPVKDSTLAVTKVDQAAQVLAVNKRQTSPKLKWGLDISGGIMFNRNHALTLEKAPRISRLNYNNLYASANPSGPGGPSTGGPAPIQPPSPVKSGLAFKAGLVTEVSLTSKSSFLTGIRYAYLSENIRVGAFYDTLVVSSTYQAVNSVNGAYRGSAQRDYTNRYHFVEVPLFYQLQLNRNDKLSVLWNAGVAAGLLISTNALVYDPTAGGIYYRNKDAFNKFHFNLETGFSLRFGSRSSVPWSLGPSLSLDLSSLTKKDAIVAKRYPMYGGITATVLFVGHKK